MGTKERIAERLERLARLVPGIGSYQDKESRRDADKRLRTTLAERLDSCRKVVEGVIAKLQRENQFSHLDTLGRLERKLHQAADSIRFASYGYSGTFDAVKIYEDKLDRLYVFDIGLAELVSTLQETAKALKSISPRDIEEEALESLEGQVASFLDKVQERNALFREG
jgi:hypothetical protein